MHSPHRIPRLSRAIAIALVSVMLCTLAVTVTATPAQAAPAAIAVYGDSLVQESRFELFARLGALYPGVQILDRTMGGTAQCDWHGAMMADVSNYSLQGAIIAFSGNNLTPCITSRPYTQAYYDDAKLAADWFTQRSVPIIFVAAPGRIETTPESRVVPNIYKRVAQEKNIAIAESGNFLHPHYNVYKQYQPCLIGECTGLINSRAPDGGHLCPVAITGDRCPVYSSGITRYADTMVVTFSAIKGNGQIARFMTVVPPPQTTTAESLAYVNLTTSTQSFSNQYRYLDMTNVADYVVQPGDRLAYDVRYSSYDARVGLDVTTSAGANLRDSGATDQRGLSAHPNTDLSSRALNTWYSRTIPLPASMTGQTLVHFDLAGEREGYSAAGSIRQARIIAADGTLRHWIYEAGTPTFVSRLTSPSITASTRVVSATPPPTTTTTTTIPAPTTTTTTTTTTTIPAPTTTTTTTTTIPAPTTTTTTTTTTIPSVTPYLEVTSRPTTGIGNLYSYQGIRQSELVLRDGDRLVYDVRYSTADAKIAFDLTTRTGTTLRDSGARDQNGLSAHPATDLTARALNTWYTRTIPIPRSMMNQSVSWFDLVAEKDAGTAIGAVRSVRIVDRYGKVKRWIYTSGTPTLVTHLQTPGYSASVTAKTS